MKAKEDKILKTKEERDCIHEYKLIAFVRFSNNQHGKEIECIKCKKREVV